MYFACQGGTAAWQLPKQLGGCQVEEGVRAGDSSNTEVIPERVDSGTGRNKIKICMSNAHLLDHGGRGGAALAS